MSTTDNLFQIDHRLKALESRLSDTGYAMNSIVQSEVSKNFQILESDKSLFGMYTALCINTIDPWKQNRVRYFSPLLHNVDTPADALPFAFPVSSMGGFDDSGLNWVPPAGSTLCLMFMNGNRHSAYYIGTAWHRDRGPDGEHIFEYPIEEYQDNHEGHRKGYLVGPNDGSQVFPPWNTESYNGNDIDSLADFDDDPEAQQKITYPNIYGFKTPQKHSVKMVDGNYKCNHRWKRMEFFSSCGNYMIFKDDHIHNAGQWANQDNSHRTIFSAEELGIEATCAGLGGDAVDICNDEGGFPLEDMECAAAGGGGGGGGGILSGIAGALGLGSAAAGASGSGGGETSNSSITDGHPSVGDDNGQNYENIDYNLGTNKGYNPYFKHSQECRPIDGPKTPQNNKVMLPQTGIQFLSISGHTFGMDDSVEEPSGVPEWERSKDPFDFGCSDKYLGKTFWISATGHKIVMSDVENEESKLRGVDNYIRLLSATGNKIELNDHTVGQADAPGCPPNTAGEKRGISMQTTSNHVFEMIDNLNEQCGEARKEGGTPNNKAKKAFVKIRTGYGLEMAFNDYDRENDKEGSQEKTINQYIQIFCPHTDNKERGPHIMRFQEKEDGPGQVYLKVGGDYICQTYDQHVTTVGDIEKNPSNRILNVSQHNLVETEEVHFHKAKVHVIQAEEVGLFLAGSGDCKPSGEAFDAASAAGAEFDDCGPCAWPVLCLTPKGITISDRVFVSASAEAQCAHILSLLPFHSCDSDKIETC
jgi:hypothetical protein